MILEKDSTYLIMISQLTYRIWSSGHDILFDELKIFGRVVFEVTQVRILFEELSFDYVLVRGEISQNRQSSHQWFRKNRKSLNLARSLKIDKVAISDSVQYPLWRTEKKKWINFRILKCVVLLKYRKISSWQS